MTEYLLIATGSGHPMQDVSMSFFVTADPAPFVQYFTMGLVLGLTVGLVFSLVLVGVVRRTYDARND
jgi:hypothetical protein